MLTTGFVVLKDFVGNDLYNHFLLLCTGIRTLACPGTHIENSQFAEDVLQQFVVDYTRIYDERELVLCEKLKNI